MIELGAGWLKEKKDKEGAAVLKDGRKVFNISCQVFIPFLGKLNFILSRVLEKQNEKMPDYTILCFPDDDKKGSASTPADGRPGNEEYPY